jgi:hypothetical protein
MCCGNKRTAMRVGATGKATLLANELSRGGTGQPSGPFVNVSGTGFTVIAPGSGRQYNFARPGEQVQVDPRDRAFLAKIQQLRQVH